MEKMSIIRFKPKPEYFDEYVAAITDFISSHKREGIHQHYVMTKDDEVFSIVIRDADMLEKSAKEGVEFLDTVRHMLQEFNPIDRHTIPLTGDLVFKEV